MEEKEARKIQKLADFSSPLLELEEAFESARQEIETKFSNLHHDGNFLH